MSDKSFTFDTPPMNQAKEPTTGSGGSAMAYRESAISVLRHSVERLRRQASGLEDLADALENNPGVLTPEAEEALWELAVRR